jgi:hypothetical protein
MTLIGNLFSALVLACLPLAAQTGGPASVAFPAPGAKVAELACDEKGCPKLDQHGHPPVSCTHQSGMATAWQCILLCTYSDSKWGTIVASSNCN